MTAQMSPARENILGVDVGLVKLDLLFQCDASFQALA